MHTPDYNIENLARDLAFEIHLGGDRFGPDDVCEWLKGIPESDLKIFRERVLLHARDFAPAEPMYESFASRMVGEWLAGIQTAETLGREVKGSWYAGLTLSNDKGKHFLFLDGSNHTCNAATVEAAWGRDVRKDIAREISEKDLAEHWCGVLLQNYGHNRNGSVQVDFITHCSLPEGTVCAVRREKDGLFLVMDSDIIGASVTPFGEVFDAYPSLLSSAVSYELDERIFRDVREAETRRADVADFKKRAGELIDKCGERVRLDFLYDQVLLESNDRGSVYVRRSVDDLSPKESLSFYIYTKTSTGSSVSLVSEDFDAGALANLTKAVDKALGFSPDGEDVSFGPDRVNFVDGPVVMVPEFGSDIPLRMKVESLYVGIDGALMVEGTVKGDGREFQSSYYLSSLSDKGVLAVREASDKALGVFQSRQPVPELKQKASVENQKRKGPSLKQ